MMLQPLILASSSPRRRELMTLTGIPFEIRVSSAPEITVGAPDYICEENARRKAEAVSSLYPGRFVVSADTLVWAGGEALGKPRDGADAKRMLGMLSGCWHEVYTGICLTNGEKTLLSHDVTRVHFDLLTEKEIDDYILTGEPKDKAGAYAVQGRAGMFIDRLEGSYSNVIGLSMSLLRGLLKQAGLTE